MVLVIVLKFVLLNNFLKFFVWLVKYFFGCMDDGFVSIFEIVCSFGLCVGIVKFGVDGILGGICILFISVMEEL